VADYLEVAPGHERAVEPLATRCSTIAGHDEAARGLRRAGRHAGRGFVASEAGAGADPPVRRAGADAAASVVSVTGPFDPAAGSGRGCVVGPEAVAAAAVIAPSPRLTGRYGSRVVLGGSGATSDGASRHQARFEDLRERLISRAFGGEPPSRCRLSNIAGTGDCGIDR
jgi:hypothetical protein